MYVIVEKTSNKYGIDTSIKKNQRNKFFNEIKNNCGYRSMSLTPDALCIFFSENKLTSKYYKTEN